jgi:hypothetical protein
VRVSGVPAGSAAKKARYDETRSFKRGVAGTDAQNAAGRDDPHAVRREVWAGAARERHR